MCNFEVGKTYKNKLGEEFLVVFISDRTNLRYPIKTINMATHTIVEFKKDGICYDTHGSHDLLPNLEPKVGHFYLDNHGDLRILAYVTPTEFNAKTVLKQSDRFTIYLNTFPKHNFNSFTLVKELSFSEAEKIITEYNSNKGGSQ